MNSTRPRFRIGTLVATTRRILGYDWLDGDGSRLPDLPTSTTVIIQEAKRVPGIGWRYRTRPAAGVANADYWVEEDALDLPLLGAP